MASLKESTRRGDSGNDLKVADWLSEVTGTTVTDTGCGDTRDDFRLRVPRPSHTES